MCNLSCTRAESSNELGWHSPDSIGFCNRCLPQLYTRFQSPVTKVCLQRYKKLWKVLGGISSKMSARCCFSAQAEPLELEPSPNDYP